VAFRLTVMFFSVELSANLFGNPFLWKIDGKIYFYCELIARNYLF